MSYKWCAVPSCTNTSVKTPVKLFVCVPKNTKMRRKWFQLGRRNPASIADNSTVYFCEDHFDMEKDMANYYQYKMGFSQRIIMADGVLPSKFHCHQESRKRKCKAKSLQTWDRNTSTKPVSANKSVQFNLKQKANFRSKAVQIKTKDTPVSPNKHSTKSIYTSPFKDIKMSLLMFECRACLRKVQSFYKSRDIFKPWTEEEFPNSTATSIAAEMANVANVEIPDVKGYPRHICKLCFNRLKTALPFIQDVRSSEEILKNRQQCPEEYECEEESLEKIWPKPIQLHKNLNGEVLRNSTEVEVKQEVISDEEFGDTEIDDGDKNDDLSVLEIKVEPDEITEHPAIQVTVNDCQATEVLIGLEDEVNLDNGVNMKNDNSNVKRAMKRKTMQDVHQDQASKCVEEIVKLNAKQLRVSLTRIDNNQCRDIGSDSEPSTTFDFTKPSTKTRKTKEKTIKIVDPPCNCKNNCRGKLSDEQRQNICDYYHSGILVNQRAFIMNFTSKENVRRHRNILHPKKSRQFTFKYYLPLDITSGDLKTANKIRVCKEMFINTILSNIKLDKVWKSSKTVKLPTSRIKYKRKNDTDAFTSVCEHFKILQIDKLKQLKEISSSTQEKPIKKLSFNKMYNLYRIWIQSTNYTNKVKSYETYKNIILKNIPQDQIQTLQQGSPSTIAKKQKKAPIVHKELDNSNRYYDNQEVLLGLIKDENVDEFVYEHLESINSDEAESSQDHNMLDPMQEEISLDELISSMTERSQSTSEEVVNDIDTSENSSDSESIRSNFSEEFKKEIKEEENNGQKKKRPKKKIKRKTLEDSSNDDLTDESTDEEFDIENIKKEIIPKMCTRNSGIPDKTFYEQQDLLKQLDMTNDYIKNAENDDEQLLTAKLKRPTRDPSVIRQYCKYHGLAYVTNSGRIVPKKVLRPPCACIKKCSTKISQEQRQFVFDYFWSLGSKKKLMLFIRNHTARVPTQKLLPNAKNHEFRYQYFLPTTKNIDTNAEKVKVCLKMFYNTLACSSVLTTEVWNEEDKNSKQENSSQQEKINKDNEEERLVKRFNKRRSRARDPEHDHTIIDFVYRAMPFEEYMAHFGSEKKVNIVGPLDTGEDQIPMKIKNKNLETKIKRNLGKRYINRSGKIIAEKTMRPACNCTKLCSNKITESQRQFLFKYYWALGSISKQRAFLVRFTSREYPKFHKRFSNKRREYVFTYYLPVTGDFDGDKVRVCQTMFINTFAISERLCFRAWLLYEEGKFSDKRGKCKGRQIIKKKYDSVKFVSALDHFNFLQQKDSRMEAFKLYLNTKQYPNGMYSPGKLYTHYTEWFDPTKYSRKIETFKQYLYSWPKLKKRLSI